MTTLRTAHRDYKDFENALKEEAHLFEAVHPGVQVQLISDGIVTRALSTDDPSVAILEAAQHEIERKGIRFR